MRIKAIAADRFGFSVGARLRKWSRSSLAEDASVLPPFERDWLVAFGNESVYGCFDGFTQRWDAGDLSEMANRFIGWDQGIPVYGYDDRLYISNIYTGSRAREIWQLANTDLSTVDTYTITAINDQNSIRLRYWTHTPGFLFALWVEPEPGEAQDFIRLDKVDQSTMARTDQLEFTDKADENFLNASLVHGTDSTLYACVRITTGVWRVYRIDPSTMSITHTKDHNGSWPMVFGPDDFLYVTTGAGTIEQLDPADLSTVKTLTSPASHIAEIAADPDGFLYKPDSDGRIEKINISDDVVDGTFDEHLNETVPNACINESIPDMLNAS